jgi:hypothetical protein
LMNVSVDTGINTLSDGSAKGLSMTSGYRNAKLRTAKPSINGLLPRDNFEIFFL